MSWARAPINGLVRACTLPGEIVSVRVGGLTCSMMMGGSIYSILAVSFYKERNEEYFGTFTRSLFTLFQVCTGDGWASDIARPLFHGEGGTDGADHKGLDGWAALFFISFIVIVGWTLLQVYQHFSIVLLLCLVSISALCFSCPSPLPRLSFASSLLCLVALVHLSFCACE